MSTTVSPAGLCGARRPGWETGPTIGANRIPCVLSAEHEGEYAAQLWAVAEAAGR